MRHFQSQDFRDVCQYSKSGSCDRGRKRSESTAPFLWKSRECKRYQKAEVRVDGGMKGFTSRNWIGRTIPNIVAVSIISPSGERIPRVPIRRGVMEVYRFVFEGTTIFINYKLLVEKSNSELIFLE